MIKLPLKQTILLVTKSGDFICKVKYAGKETFKLSEVKRQVYGNNEVFHIPICEDEFVIDRQSVTGYSYVNNDFLNAAITINDSKPKNTLKIIPINRRK